MVFILRSMINFKQFYVYDVWFEDLFYLLIYLSIPIYLLSPNYLFLYQFTFFCIHQIELGFICVSWLFILILLNYVSVSQENHSSPLDIDMHRYSHWLRAVLTLHMISYWIHWFLVLLHTKCWTNPITVLFFALLSLFNSLILVGNIYNSHLLGLQIFSI